MIVDVKLVPQHSYLFLACVVDFFVKSLTSLKPAGVEYSCTGSRGTILESRQEQQQEGNGGLWMRILKVCGSAFKTGVSAIFPSR